MRIIHVIDYFQPRLGYQETFLAREQLRAGHVVTVLTSDRYRAFPGYAHSVGGILGDRVRGPGRAVEEGIPVDRLPILFEKSDRAWIRGLERAVIGLRPDVVHVHAVASISTLRVALALRGRPTGLVIDDHMLQVVVRRTILAAGFYRLIPAALRLLVPKTARYVGVSDETRRYIVEQLGVDPARVRMIPLGSDDRTFAPDRTARERLRAQLGLKADEKLVVYTGKLVAEKGPDILIAAVALLPPSLGLHVLLVGAGQREYVARLREAAKRGACLGRLHFHEPVPSVELAGFYNAADICVWPRQASTSVLDAAACAKPVIVADEPVGRERVAAGNGLTYREGDPHDLARALLRLADDGTFARNCGEAGLRLIRDSLSWQRLAVRFEALYEEARQAAVADTPGLA